MHHLGSIHYRGQKRIEMVQSRAARYVVNIKQGSLEGFKTLDSGSVSGQSVPIPDGSWVE
jgi:hypothetical protein